MKRHVSPSIPLLIAVAMSITGCATVHPTQSGSTPSRIPSDDIVTITNSCGVMDPVTLRGRVMYRALDGTLKPLTGVTITRSRDAGFLTAGLKAQSYRTDKKGRFLISMIRGVESTQVRDGGQTRESETIESVTFSFELSGCEPLEWHPALDGQQVTIEMNCPVVVDGLSGG
jgi:hypothetical protein